MDDLDRFLELIKRELGSDDARFEYGGHEPESGNRIWARMLGGWRVLALYDAPPNDRNGKQAKLDGMVASFTGVTGRLGETLPRVASAIAAEEVDYALGVLAEKTKALRALVLDEDSPVLWGSSESPRGPEDVETAEWTGELVDSASQAGLDLVELVAPDEAGLIERLATLESRKLRDRLLRRLPVIRELGLHRDAEAWRLHFLVCRVIAAIRRAPERHYVAEPGIGWLARDFGGIYHVVLVYPGEFSELSATGVLLRALPAIENLVLALPPIEPTPKGARVLQFPPKR
ncbi:hypothetical protein ACNOYE_15890 [Nannocystaceae bacterium ST9]